MGSRNLLNKKCSVMIALVDINSAYCSMIKCFRPDLEGKPVIVLSNNDGCVVARCQLAKDIGIKMGQPFFELKELIRKHKVEYFSSNYTLFADMSGRVMRTLAKFTPSMEIYSIDEAFLDLSNMPYDLEEYAQEIRHTLRKNIGIPVGIGVGQTKVLAKIANHISKKYPEYKEKGVFILKPEMRDAVLAEFPIEEVWGIGRQHTKRLLSAGVKTALDFTELPESWIKAEMSVVETRLYRELKGQSCLPLEEFAKTRKNICTSRSFPKSVESKSILCEAVSNFAAKCAFKLRKEKTCAGVVTVFVETNRFDTNSYYSNSLVLALPVASNDTSTLIHYALKGLNCIFQAGCAYKKAGVLVSSIVPAANLQGNLFEAPSERKVKAMKVMDKLNAYMGSEKVKIAAQGFNKAWQLKAERMPQCYTTRWDQLMTINLNK